MGFLRAYALFPVLLLVTSLLVLCVMSLFLGLPYLTLACCIMVKGVKTGLKTEASHFFLLLTGVLLVLKQFPLKVRLVTHHTVVASWCEQVVLAVLGIIHPHIARLVGGMVLVSEVLVSMRHEALSLSKTLVAFLS